MKTIPYGRQNITQQDIDAVVKTLTSDFLTQGPKINEFEEKFAAYVNAKYAVAVANGTAALHLSALALNVDKKSKVITTPITFAASANCVRYCGGEVVFADVDPGSILLDVAKVRALLEAAPKGTYQGLIPVDFAGFPLNMEEFRRLADQHGLWIIEDACHAVGGHFTDSNNVRQRCGNGKYAELSIFSFHPVKHIATGEGGMITTNDPKLYEKLLKLRTHGITKDPGQLEKNDGGWYYEMQELGFNYRIPDILCALGISQLTRAEEGLARRKEIARTYDEAFMNIDGIKSVTLDERLEQSGISHAYHLYVIRTKERLKLYNHLKANGIFAQVHYIPVYQMPNYQKNGFSGVHCPHAEEYYNECLSLPMYPTLSASEQEFVIESIIKFIKNL